MNLGSFPFKKAADPYQSPLEGRSSEKVPLAWGFLSAVAFLGPESAASARSYMVE